MRMRSWRVLIGVPGALLAAAVVPGLASASNHLIKVREVYAGSSSNPNSEYVELQMYAPGQNLFHLGTELKLYAANGSVSESFVPGDTANDDPPNSQSQQRVLFANAGAKAEFGVNAGYTLAQTNAISNGGGAVCWIPSTPGFEDCVSWGNFSGSLPSSAGGTVDPSGIPNVTAINRSIARGCSTLLEAGDDTNKPGDWNDVIPNPLNNAATPPEKACPNATITKKPKSKTTDKTPTFKFKASGSGVTFACRIDKGRFASCTSPFTTKKLSKGEHTFQVRATNSVGGVGNAARASFKVVKHKRHH